MNNLKWAKGILRELHVFGHPIIIKSNNKFLKLYIELIEEEIGYSSKTCIFLIHGLEQQAEKKITFMIYTDSSRLEGTAQHLDKNKFELLNLDTIQEKRCGKRLSPQQFSYKDLIAELRLPNQRHIATIGDWTGDYLRVWLPSINNKIEPSTPVELSIFENGKEIFKDNKVIEFIRENNSGLDLILCGLSKLKIKNRRSNRKKIDSISLPQITARWPSSDGELIHIEIENFNLVGFGAKWIKGHYIPVGAIITFNELFIGRIVWSSEDRCGIDLGNTSRENIAKYHQFIEMHTNQTGLHTSNRRAKEQILSLSLRSGYLTGRKANDFRHDKRIHSLIPSVEATGQWLFRFIKKDSDNLPALHVSFLRTSDSGIFVQEVGNASKQSGNAAKFLKQSLLETYYLERDYSNLNTVVFGIYDPKNQFNALFWEKIEATKMGEFSNAAVINIEAIPTYTTSLTSSEISVANWNEIYKILKKRYSILLLSAFGLIENEYRSPVLRQYLLTSHFILRRQISLIRKDNSNVAVLLNLGLPTYSNTRYTPSTHLWIFPLKDLKTDQIQELVNAKEVFQESVSLGSREAVIIDSNNSILSEFRHFKIACWKLHDSLKVIEVLDDKK